MGLGFITIRFLKVNAQYLLITIPYNIIFSLVFFVSAIYYFNEI